MTKAEEAFIKRFTTMNLKLHVIQYVIEIVAFCEDKIIELEK